VVVWVRHTQLPPVIAWCKGVSPDATCWCTRWVLADRFKTIPAGVAGLYSDSRPHVDPPRGTRGSREKRTQPKTSFVLLTISLLDGGPEGDDAECARAIHGRRLPPGKSRFRRKDPWSVSMKTPRAIGWLYLRLLAGRSLRCGVGESVDGRATGKHGAGARSIPRLTGDQSVTT